MVPGHLVSSPLKTGLVFTLEYLRVYGGPVSWPSGSLGVWSLASVGVHNNYVKQIGNPPSVHQMPGNLAFGKPGPSSPRHSP